MAHFDVPQVNDGILSTFPYISRTAMFIAARGDMFIAEHDLQLDALHVKGYDACQLYPHLRGRVQLRLKDDWRDWLRRALGNKGLNSRNFSLYLLAPGLCTQVIPAMLELQESCERAGGR